MSPVSMLALIVVVLLGSATAANAADSIVKPDPPGVWRLLGPDDKDTTSKCIAKPKTPICAVETVLACFTRGDNSLCKSVLVDEWPEQRGNPYLPFDSYRFVGSMRVGGKGWWRAVERRFGGHYRSILPRARTGDLVVFVTSIPCRARTDCFEDWRDKKPPDLYALRRVEGVWKITDMTGAVF